MTSVPWILLQSIAADYRQEVYYEFAETTGGGVISLSGEATFDPTTRAVEPRIQSEQVQNIFLVGRRLLWQRGVLGVAASAPWVIAEFNPRIVSTWVLVAWRRLMGRPSVFWGHAFPRGGPESKTDLVRRPLRRLARFVLTYSEADAVALRRCQPGVSMLEVRNALYRRRDIHTESPSGAE